MKFLKNLFAFLIPLLSMLITFSIFLLIDNVVDNYKSKISRDYSIIIVTNTPLEKDAIKELGGIKVERITIKYSMLQRKLHHLIFQKEGLENRK